MKQLLFRPAAALRDAVRSLAQLWWALPSLMEMHLVTLARSDRGKVIAAVRTACLAGCDEAEETRNPAVMEGAGIVLAHVTAALLALDRTNTAAEDVAARHRTLGKTS
ncbi:hypothetical protein ACIQCF_33255 [Streptomyces sp. NPDC088353]|uniref:hypothetical protein n=1 Tax=Streptomyces sp. NPDC088353 TaxID=3365855 RepID=UPI003805050D